MSATAYRCPSCRRRVRSAPYAVLKDRRSRKETRYHGGSPSCLEAGALEAERRGPGEIVLNFIHAITCGDPASRLRCVGRCFEFLADQQEGEG